MFSNIREQVMTAIRGNAETHGVIACLRCATLTREIDRIEQELDVLKQNATIHFAQRHSTDSDSPIQLNAARSPF